MKHRDCNISELLGKIVVKCYQGENPYYGDNETLIFECSDGSKYVMTHMQDCCESVVIETIEGSLNDLLAYPILLAEESTRGSLVPETYDSETWTFYKLATIKGYVDIRWHGTSNGYYSEAVNFFKVTEDNH